MSGTLKCKLGDVIKFGNGKARPVGDGTIPVYGGNGILGHSNDSNYSDETIVIGRVGAYCGATYYEDRPIWVSDNALAAIPKNNNDIKYLFYFLKNLDLNQHAQGSSHPLVTQSLLNSIDAEIIVDPGEQTAIASTLASLDDKIDLLQRQNKTLEAMADTLFRQWFMEDTREDWGAETLANYVIHLKENVKPASTPLQKYTHYSLPAFDAGMRPVEESGSEILSNKYTVEPWTFLVSKLNPRFPRIWPIGEVAGYNAICSTEFQVFKPKDHKLYGYLYFLLRSDYAKDELSMASSGTSGSHQRVRREDILNLKSSVPSIQVAENFSELVFPGILKSMRNLKQIKVLEDIRDTLLPKLMSGDVRVEL